MLSAKWLLEKTKPILQNGSNGKVIIFGDDVYAQANLVEGGKIIIAIGVSVK